MSIRFDCEKCGHPIEVDDRFGGKRATCKHCGQHLVIPDPGVADEGPPLRLRPLEEGEPPGVPGHLLGPETPLTVRPEEADPHLLPKVISEPDAPPAGRRAGDDYPVLDPFGYAHSRGRAGPPPRWMLLPSLTARFLAGRFRTARDWLYVASIGCLVMVLLGYLFQWKVMLHLGALGVVASNIGMLVAGVAYLVTLPFKESLLHGLANLLIPFYAVYYWTTRWPRMKTPVYKTLGSFVPILLVAVAYLAYEEAPVVEAEIEKEIPVIEQAIGTRAPAVDAKVKEALGPLEPVVDPASDPSRESAPRQPRRHRR